MTDDGLSPETIDEIERALLPGVGFHHLSHAAFLLVEVAELLGDTALSADLERQMFALLVAPGDQERSTTVLSEWVTATSPSLVKLMRQKGVAELYPLVYLPCCGRTMRTYFLDSPGAPE